jgi:LPS-assembly lipoprotein
MLLARLTPFSLNKILQNCGWLMLIAALTSCGFHLREPAQLAFKSVYVTGRQTLINPELRKVLKGQNIKQVNAVEDADLQIDLLKEENEKRILSLSGTGVVREYELYYRIQYRTKLAGETIWALPKVIETRRDYTYNDSNLLAKGAEEIKLLEAMHTEVVNNLIRRLSALKKVE